MGIQVNMTDTVQDYVTRMSLREPDVLADLRERTAALPQRTMQISPEQGQFLALLLHAVQAKRALEVGVFTGYSLLRTALALPDDGTVTACDISEEWTAVAREYCDRAGVLGKVDLRIGDARETLAKLVAAEGEPYDFAFIDADKQSYEQYFEYALQLVRTGGLIVVDNVLWSGDVADETVDDAETRALRAFNAKIRDDERVHISMLPIADGLTLAVKR
ncbi:class I SAM-dependent methyltransferase [Streptomyces sp. NPDC047108]|uniref:class I SAM-dependent methyltransferase n=1 Tax=Streptomyces sp. NPDC047108 TaxID=3155025 RepID=UPI003406244F